MSCPPARLSPALKAAISLAIASGAESSTIRLLYKKNLAGLITFAAVFSPYSYSRLFRQQRKQGFMEALEFQTGPLRILLSMTICRGRAAPGRRAAASEVKQTQTARFTRPLFDSMAGSRTLTYYRSYSSTTEQEPSHVAYRFFNGPALSNEVLIVRG
jgi:hypothetical protein